MFGLEGRNYLVDAEVGGVFDLLFGMNLFAGLLNILIR